MFAGTGLSAGKKKGKLYVDDVFSTYLYTGNGSTQTITNGIDLAGEGGLVWIKSRNGTEPHQLFDSSRGVTKSLATSQTVAERTVSDMVTSFTSTGFTLGNDATFGWVNLGAMQMSSWTFRKAPKFFDVVTYTGNGTTQTINHSLGVVPGMIIVKDLTTSNSWTVYHVSTGAGNRLVLNSTIAAIPDASVWNNTSPTSTQFMVGAFVTTNTNGNSYVAYLFAHDTATDGIIQCGSFTPTAGTHVNLGWEPQYLLLKRTDSTSNWFIIDSMRGMTNGPYINEDRLLMPNLSSEEILADYVSPDATGFTVSQTLGTTYIYLAIRRPNKPPTSGTQVYNAIARYGTDAAATITGIGFDTDLVIATRRGPEHIYKPTTFFDRLRGAARALQTGGYNGTLAEDATFTTSLVGFDTSNGIRVGDDAAKQCINAYITNGYINHFFRRAPSFFDVVCYTGTGVSDRLVNHNLGAIPELLIIKQRNSASNWYGYTSVAANKYFTFNSNIAFLDSTGSIISPTGNTSTQFRLDTDNNLGINSNNQTFVAYLFATLAGISKVFSYTGNGSSQTINCGFSAGARFVLIKHTDSTGDWYVWDSVRGIVAANDPHLSLNTTAAEVTTDDSIDPDTSGFIVNQVAATNINVNGATYIGLAIA